LTDISAISVNQRTFTVGSKRWAHLSNEQYSSQVLRPLQVPKIANINFSIPREWADPPESWNWVTKNIVGPVQNQGNCGDVWVLVPVDQVSSVCAKQMQKPVYVQGDKNIVESCVTQGLCACTGGLIQDVYTYMEKAGIVAGNTPCRSCPNNTNPFCMVTKTTILPFGDEDALKAALYNEGPITVAIDASHTSFQLYSSGIYYEPNCQSRQPDHLLMLVGYGVSGNTPYWIAQNSWGTDWGQEGYIWLARNRRNNCGVASFPYAVQVKRM